MKILTTITVILILILVYLLAVTVLAFTALVLPAAEEITADPGPERIIPRVITVDEVEKGLEGKVIFLDPGHGVENPNDWKDYREHVTMLDLALKIKHRLEALGAEVILTRETENDVYRSVRCAIINKRALKEIEGKDQEDTLEIERLIGIMESVIKDPEEYGSIYFNTPYDYSHVREIHPDLKKVFEYQDDREISERFLLISLHSNSTGRPIDTSFNGVDVFYISNDLKNNASYYSDYSHMLRSFYLGSLLMDEISKIGFEKNDVTDFFFFMLREHNIPAVLVENGYHTNDKDRAKLMDDVFLERLAAVYASVVLEYFESHL